MRLMLHSLWVLSIAGCPAEGENRSVSQPPVAFLPYEITAGLQCEPAAGLLGCLRAHERLQALHAAPAATRRGERLCLGLRSGPTCFDDGAGFGYALFGREQAHYVVVETEATGGYAVILVNAAGGEQHRVDNRPLYSSQPGIFATVSYDTDAGYVPNRVAIWSAARSEPIHVFDGFAPGEGPTGIRWRGPSTLEVRYTRQPFSPDEGAAHTFRIRQDAKGVWRHNYTR